MDTAQTPTTIDNNGRGFAPLVPAAAVDSGVAVTDIDRELPGERPHIPALDGVRGMAILLVLAYHFYPGTPTNTFDFWCVRLTHAGWCGVDLFFVLSGFLITGILWDARHTRHYFRSFYLRRTLRIFPLYYATITVLLVFASYLGSEVTDRLSQLQEHQIWYWTYLSNVLVAWKGTWLAVPFWAIPLWSLAVEEQFYLLWPFVVLRFSRRALMRVCALGFVIAWLLRVIIYAAHAHRIAAYVLLPTRMDTLLLGAFLALYLRGPTVASRDLRVARYVFWTTLLALAALFIVRKGLDAYDAPTLLAGYTLLALFFGSVVFRAAASQTLHGGWRIFQQTWLRQLGKYSYGIYVLHRFAERILRKGRLRLGMFPGLGDYAAPRAFLYVIVCCVGSVVVAICSYHLFEKHFLKLKRFFPYA